MIPSGKIAQAVSSALREDQRVALGYLFGSAVTDHMGPLSDVDVAVLPLEGVDSVSFPGELMDKLCRTLQTNQVDLIDLSTASIPLRYGIIKDGRLLLSRDEALRQRFESQTVMRYLDIQPMRKRCFRMSREKILERGK